MNPFRRTKTLHCSFCRRSAEEVSKLVGGPGVFICDQCVSLSQEIIEDDARRSTIDLRDLTAERLLETLVPAALEVDQASDALHSHVQALREKGVSWTQIGEALGVSRQAAWERFS